MTKAGGVEGGQGRELVERGGGQLKRSPTEGSGAREP